MKNKYTLLINNTQEGTVCWKGEGTIGQVKGNIEELIGKKGIEPENLEVIPVIGSRMNLWKISTIVLGLGITGWAIYENLCKRARKRRKYSSS